MSRRTGMLVASLEEAARDCRAKVRRAVDAYRSLSDQSTPYAGEIAELIDAHGRAAMVYETALAKANADDAAEETP